MEPDGIALQSLALINGPQLQAQASSHMTVACWIDDYDGNGLLWPDVVVAGGTRRRWQIRSISGE
jgi:hypothetical protein